jgi:hypothetical protein
MRTLARVIGVVVMVIGALALVTPAQFIALGDSILTPAGMYAIAVVRILVGVLLFVAAQASRAPTVLRVVGLVVVAAGIATPLFGADRSRQVFDWWASQGPVVLHAPGVLLSAIGGGLIYLLGARRVA